MASGRAGRQGHTGCTEAAGWIGARWALSPTDPPGRLPPPQLGGESTRPDREPNPPSWGMAARVADTNPNTRGGDGVAPPGRWRRVAPGGRAGVRARDPSPWAVGCRTGSALSGSACRLGCALVRWCLPRPTPDGSTPLAAPLPNAPSHSVCVCVGSHRPVPLPAEQSARACRKEKEWIGIHEQAGGSGPAPPGSADTGSIGYAWRCLRQSGSDRLAHSLRLQGRGGQAVSARCAGPCGVVGGLRSGVRPALPGTEARVLGFAAGRAAAGRLLGRVAEPSRSAGEQPRVQHAGRPGLALRSGAPVCPAAADPRPCPARVCRVGPGDWVLGVGCFGLPACCRW